MRISPGAGSRATWSGASSPRCCADRLTRRSDRASRDGKHDVHLTSPDGSELLRLTDDAAFESAPFWTRDARVVFSIWADSVSRTPALFNPVYSPDQKRIAFARADSTRQGQIWVMNADGTGEHQLTRFSAGDGTPAR